MIYWFSLFSKLTRELKFSDNLSLSLSLFLSLSHHFYLSVSSFSFSSLVSSNRLRTYFLRLISLRILSFVAVLSVSELTPRNVFIDRLVVCFSIINHESVQAVRETIEKKNKKSYPFALPMNLFR